MCATSVASGKVLKSETVEKMWTAQNTSDRTKSVFGLGWGVFSMGRESKDGRDERTGAVDNGVLEVSPRLGRRSGVGVQCGGCARALRATLAKTLEGLWAL